MVLLLLTACGRHVEVPSELPTDSIWEKMAVASSERERPFRMQISIRFGVEGDTRRVTALLWGNGDDRVRLDVMAGVGATVAMLEEDGDEFLLYTPRDNRAYSHSGPNRPMFKIGVPVPFDLATLAAILNGNFTAAFGKMPESVDSISEKAAIYKIGGRLAGELELDGAGAPVSWSQASGGWRLRFTYPEESPYLPKSIRFENSKGQYALVLVKEREEVEGAFESGQLMLKIPAGVKLEPLSQFRQMQAAK